MKKIIYLAICLLIISCGQENNSNNNNTQRIVCVSKQYNEIICALGAEQNLVGTDVSSTFPDKLNNIPKVGYHRALSIEGILSLNPTAFFHDNNVGPENVMQQLKELNVNMRSFIKAETIDSTKMLIRELGAYFNKPKEADSLCNQLDAEMQIAITESSKYTAPIRVLIIHYGQASNTYLVMTSKSTGAKMIQWAGGTMAVSDNLKGMKPLSAEVIAESNPDVILLTDFGYDKLGSIESIKDLPGLRNTKASIDNKIYRIKEHDLVYLGPRTGKNVLDLQKLIHQ
jgi:iron complex transport system substrate-binding protein